jgi:hypothetical protein
MNFWDCIPVSKLGQAYADLACYQAKRHGVTLDEPQGLRGDSEPLPPVINAPLYEEEQQIETAREMSQPPHSPERVQ